MGKNFFKFNGLFFTRHKELTPTELKTLIFMCGSMSYGGNAVNKFEFVPAASAQLGLKPVNLRRIIKRLKEKGFIYKSPDEVHYIVNEEFASKGR